MNGFLALENRYVIRGELEAGASLHVGSGAEDPLTGSDNGFITDAAGPFLPGSSLRGVLRSRLERILQGLGGRRGCVLFAEGSHPDCPTVNKGKRDAIEKLTDDAQVAEKLFTEGGLCDICRLFGSPLLASKLRISDARPVSPSDIQMNLRHGVAIDRDSGTAADRLKFDFMALEPYALVANSEDPVPIRFAIRLSIENADDNDLALLAILITELERDGIEVGGKKSRGFGQLQLKPGYRVEYFNKATIRRFLADGKPIAMSDSEFRSMLQGSVDKYFRKHFKEAGDAQTSDQ